MSSLIARFQEAARTTTTPIAVVVAVISGAITLSACASSHNGVTSEDATATTVGRHSMPVDELVRIHGARLHVRCSGVGPPTVVLIAGFTDRGTSWTKIEPTLSKTTRVCAYDRFGDGTSDITLATQTFATESGDLHLLLRSIGEPGPYIVVGHSFGGPEAVTFASQFPTEVRGLLLLDAPPPTWTAAVCAVPDDGSDTARSFHEFCVESSDPARNEERLDAPTAFSEVAKIKSLGALPMIVATADHHSFPGLATSEEARLNDVWNAGQMHWVSLGSSAQLVTVVNTSHQIQLDRPDVVLDKIHELLR